MEKLITSPNKALITEAQIRARIRELGNQISKDYADQELVLVCVSQRGKRYSLQTLHEKYLCRFGLSSCKYQAINNSTQPSKRHRVHPYW